MPGYFNQLTDLPDVPSQNEVEALDWARPTNDVKYKLQAIAAKLLFLDSEISLWKPVAEDKNTVSLKMLHDRLHQGKLSPSPLPAHNSDISRIEIIVQQRTNKTARCRPLEDYEDLYYASITKIKDTRSQISLRLANNFNAPTDRIWAGGPSISSLAAALSDFWDVLTEPALMKTLDQAIRRSRVKFMHLAVLEMFSKKEIDEENCTDLIAALYDEDKYGNLPGLAWITGWAPSMIGAWLQEKYHLVLLAEGRAEMKARFQMAVEKVQAYGRRRMKLAAEEGRDLEEQVWVVQGRP